LFPFLLILTTIPSRHAAEGDGAVLFKQACAMGLEFWLKTNVVENDYTLLGTDYDNEGKPIAYLAEMESWRSHAASLICPYCTGIIR
jgi:hypothetical protein